MQFDDFIYDLIFLLAPYLRVIRKMWSKKCIVYSDQIDSAKYYILVLQEDNLIYFDFLQNVYMCCHVTCSANIRPKHFVCVLGVFFSQLFESLHFLLFAFFSVEKLLFLFYPHSVRSCLLKSSVQSVLNHASLMCLFVLESCCISLMYIRKSSGPKIELCGTPWLLIKAVDWVRFNEFVGGVSDTPVMKFRQECHYLLYQMLFEKENSNHTVARVKCMSKISQLRLLEHD